VVVGKHGQGEFLICPEREIVSVVDADIVKTKNVELQKCVEYKKCKNIMCKC
jgi:hypothetical protein